MLEKICLKLWPAIIITIVIFAFHSRLFFPHLSIYTTPDYGRSDAWHLSIADKFYYAQELKNNRIAIWNPHIGTGYPTLAEGQTGIFFLPNLILFRLLPFVLAFNLDLIVAFLLAAFGIYLLARSLNLNKISSTYVSIVFSLGAFFVFHVQHIHLIQTAALLPWIFWSTNEFIKSKKYLYLLFLAFFVSQQIFAGFTQLCFYTLFTLTLYLGFKYFISRAFKFKTILLILCGVLLGFSLSAIQLIPSYELYSISNRSLDANKILLEFPYKIKNLAQFVNPYINGSPKDASYPKWVPEKWGIFWESSAYIGLLPLALALFNLIFFSKNKKTKETQLSFAFIGLLSLMFALGSQSPSHVIFSIPPFSMFRVPSRFLLFVQFSLAILAGITLNKLIKRPAIIALIFIITIFDLFLLLFPYNPTGNTKEWFSDPQTAQFLKGSNAHRVFSISPSIKWNDNFINSGWKNNQQFYQFARNSLDQNQNLIFGIDQFSAYESILTERSYLYENLLKKDVSVSVETADATISDKAAKLLAASNVSHIVTSFEIKNDNFEKVFETDKQDGVVFYIYKSKLSPTPYTFTNNILFKGSKNEIISAITDKDFDPQNTIILEKNLNFDNKISPQWTVDLLKSSPTKNEYQIESSTDGVFVVNQSYYPGWQAYVDGEKTNIMPANINSEGVKITKGEHTILFIYQPNSFQLGLQISFISVLATIVFYWRFKNKVINL